MQKVCEYCLKNEECETCIKEYQQLKISEKKFNNEVIGKTCVGCHKTIKDNDDGLVIIAQDFDDKNWDEKNYNWIEVYKYYHNEKCEKLEFENSCEKRSTDAKD